MDQSLFAKYLTTEKNNVKFPSDALKLDAQAFFNPKDKKEKALLFGCFSKYNHDKIRDALITCEKGFKHTEEMKYKKILYFIGIIKKLK